MNDADLYLKSNHGLDRLNRPSCADLPNVDLFSERDRQIFQIVSERLPRKEFPLFFEYLIDGFVKNQLGDEAGIEAIPALHLSVMDFYRRTIGSMDDYFDEHRSEFAAELASGDTEALIAKLMSIRVKNKPEYEGMDFTVGDMFKLMGKIIGSEDVYPSSQARALLARYYDTFFKTFFESLFLEEGDTSKMDADEVIALKAGTNIDHGHFMFLLAVVSLYDLRDIEEKGRETLEAAKLAYQIRNDVQGVAKDLIVGNANYVYAFAMMFDEAEQIRNVARMDVDFICKLPRLAPKTYAFLKCIQEALFEHTPLSNDIVKRLKI